MLFCHVESQFRKSNHALILIITIVFCLLMSNCHPGESDRSDKPNILLILADDLGYGDLSAHDNPHLETPNLDSLRQRSAWFPEFYVSPVCAPTRASLMTGLYHQRTGVQSVTNGWETMRSEVVTLAERLQLEGYRTGLFGKWHLGEYPSWLPGDQGFDQFIGFRTGHTSEYYDATLERNGEDYSTSGYITDVLTREALAFMREGDVPAFTYLAYNVPHTPLHIDSMRMATYLAQNLDERTARIYGMISELDEQVGWLWQQLQASDLLKNTIIIFMSDNGPISGWRVPQEQMRYNAGLRDQKFTLYEGGIRTPSWWYWKDHWPPGSRAEVFGAHIDVLPTLLDVLDVQVRDSFDGISLNPYLVAPDQNGRARCFFQKYALGTFGDTSAQPGGMMRNGHWKMIHGSELYNLSEDPGESTNLAAIYPDTLGAMNKAYSAWWKELVATSSLQRRPVPIGLDARQVIQLQPHHSQISGSLKFTGFRGLQGERLGTHPSGVDGDWLAGWKGRGDSVTWQVEVKRTGNYQFAVMYKSNNAIPTNVWQLSADGVRVEIEKQKWQPAAEWEEGRLGTIELRPGNHELLLSLTEDLKEGTEMQIASLTVVR